MPIQVNFTKLARLQSFMERHFPGLYGRINNLRDRNFSHLDEPELALLPALCDSGQGAIDAGANRGSYSYWMLKHAAWVLAVEPNPALIRLLRSRFRHAIATGRYQVEAAALSGRSGQVILTLPEQSALATVEMPGDLDAGQQMIVSSLRLDDLLANRPTVGFIKIDVEGHELAVLDGALQTIRRDHPTLLIEAEDRHHPSTLTGLRQRLEAQGYQGHYLLDGQLHPISEFDMERLQNRSALNETGTRRLPGQTYINNFIFTGREGITTRISEQLARARR